jgi:hypothetical protein
MGLKGYMLWAMGQLDSNEQSPTEVLFARRRQRPRALLAADISGQHFVEHSGPLRVERHAGRREALQLHHSLPGRISRRRCRGVGRVEKPEPRGVALQVAFERQTLKPAFHLIGYRLWV